MEKIDDGITFTPAERPMSEDEKFRIEAVAAHEAGHWIVANHFGVQLTGYEIYAKTAEAIHGKIKFSGSIDKRIMAVIGAAGAAGEFLVLGAEGVRRNNEIRKNDQVVRKSTDSAAIRKAGITTDDGLASLVKESMDIINLKKEDFDTLRTEVARRLRRVYGMENLVLSREEIDQIITGRYQGK